MCQCGSLVLNNIRGRNMIEDGDVLNPGLLGRSDYISLQLTPFSLSLSSSQRKGHEF